MVHGERIDEQGYMEAGSTWLDLAFLVYDSNSEHIWFQNRNDYLKLLEKCKARITLLETGALRASLELDNSLVSRLQFRQQSIICNMNITYKLCCILMIVIDLLARKSC